MDYNEDTKSTLIATIREMGGRLRVKGALNPILWVVGLVVPPGLLAMSLNKECPVVIPVIVCSVIGVALFGFIWLLLFDRNRLHSEEYLLKSKTLDLIEEKGSKKAIDAATVQAISQPEFTAITEGDAGADK